ncbi:flagellin protein flic [Heliomicrobium modesticaldum Ice1]|uniref:Flagellin n=2 Tax=Heliomicrobium modesticaldum TaxID=35701 RepID=B0TH39_HELMI|nr:flagellin protein flic [Heliomicrobium modesticaldum Ice1]
MRELAVQATNDTNTDSDRRELQNEVKQLKLEIDRIGNTTEFNTKKLLEGSAAGPREKVDGVVQINNNSSLKLSGLKALQDMFKNIGEGQAAASGVKINGAVILVREKDTSGASMSTGDFAIYTNSGGRLAGSDTTFLNISASGIRLGSQITANSAAQALQISAALSGMKVGETITFVFGKNEDAKNVLSGSMMFQIGANAGQTTFAAINDMRVKALDLSGVDISSKWGAAVAIERIQQAIEKVSAQRSLLGALQNRLEYTIRNVDTAAENIQASESRIRDVDMAKEMMNFTRLNILQQASNSMLAQANQAPQNVLSLLR